MGTGLLGACDTGRLDIVKLFVEKGANVNKPGLMDQSPLVIATAYRHFDVVQYLLEHKANPNLGRALVIAAGRGNIRIVKLLLDHQADVDVRGGVYGSAMLEAAHYGQVDVMKLLLAKGTKPQSLDGALQHAVEGRKLEVARFIIDYKKQHLRS